LTVLTLLATIVYEQLGVGMPAVQVYKNNGIMIPVDQAKQCKAYVCPWTKQLYATKRSYVAHLKRLRTDRMHRRAKELQHRRKLEDMWNQPNFDAVVRWIHNNPEVFWASAQKGCRQSADKWNKIRDTFEIKITHLALSYSDMVSNSHVCTHNGVTNWGGNNKLKDGTAAPRGYPGFTGNIELHMPVEPLSFSSDVFRGTRICTGTGGGGGGHYRYNVAFFLDDWPGIAAQIAAARAQYEKQHLLDMIKNEHKPFAVASYTYGQSRRR
jgi:hypothetical protein